MTHVAIIGGHGEVALRQTLHTTIDFVDGDTTIEEAILKGGKA